MSDEEPSVTAQRGRIVIGRFKK